MSSLRRANILIVGMGGLGCPASLALARAGVEQLTLIDPDLVELSNLHRQPWFRTSDIGKPKAKVAAERLRAAFPAIAVRALVDRLDAANGEALLRAHDAAVDGTDQVGAKFLLSDLVARTGIPVVYGGVLRMQGQVMAITKRGPCLRCLFERPPPVGEIPSCSGAGVLGSMAGVIGALQAATALRMLSGQPVSGELITFDGRSLHQRVLAVPRAQDCICSRAERSQQEASAWPA